MHLALQWMHIVKLPGCASKQDVLLLATLQDVVSCPTRTKNFGQYLARMSYASFVLISFLFVLEGK